MDNLVSPKVLLAGKCSGTGRRNDVLCDDVRSFSQVDLSSSVVIGLQQVQQRGRNWIYLLTPARISVWHKERRASDWAVYYCMLADSHSRCLSVDSLAGCCDGCFSSVCVHSPNVIVTQVILWKSCHSLLGTNCSMHNESILLRLFLLIPHSLMVWRCKL